MFADDFNRVVLKTLPGREQSDYINASYVDVRSRKLLSNLITIILTLQGYRRRKMYIASQGSFLTLLLPLRHLQMCW